MAPPNSGAESKGSTIPDEVGICSVGPVAMDAKGLFRRVANRRSLVLRSSALAMPLERLYPFRNRTRLETLPLWPRCAPFSAVNSGAPATAHSAPRGHHSSERLPAAFHPIPRRLIDAPPSDLSNPTGFIRLFGLKGTDRAGPPSLKNGDGYRRLSQAQRYRGGTVAPSPSGRSDDSPRSLPTATRMLAKLSICSASTPSRV
jgi:hypothetical protein